jgi:hypothetical protein
LFVSSWIYLSKRRGKPKEALGMKEASEGVTNILWVMIVTAFVVVLLGGGYLLYDMSKNEQDTRDPADNHDGSGRPCRLDGSESCAGEEVRAA